MGRDGRVRRFARLGGVFVAVAGAQLLPVAVSHSGAVTLSLSSNHRVRARAAASGWTSSNWSGYAVTAGPYTSVTSTWTVPKVAATRRASYSAAWVGIDGFNNNSLIQTGTEQDYYNGAGHYAAWWTTSAQGFVEQPISSMRVSPGNVMQASISQTSPGTWTINLTNVTTGVGFNKTVAYSGPGASAEWILEAPTVGGRIAPLAHYGSAVFDPGTANGVSPNLQASNSGNLIQGGVVVSTASNPDTEPAPATPDGFTMAYGSTQPAPPSS